MRKALLIVGLCVILSQSSLAQSPVREATVFLGKKTNSVTYTKVLDSLFRSCVVYELDSKAFKELVNPKENERDFRFQIQLENDLKWDLILQHAQMTTSIANIMLGKQGGMERMFLMPAVRLKGLLLNNVTNSEVRLTIDEDFIYGFIRDGNSTYFIQPLRLFIKGSPHNEFLVYEKSQAYLPTGAACGTYDHKRKLTMPKRMNEKRSAIIQQELNYYAAVDYSVYQDFDYSVRDIINTISGTINLVESNFDNEFNDPFQVTFTTPNSFYISTCPNCDPWVASGNAEDLLANFRNWGNSNRSCTDRGRLSQLWTNRDIYVIDQNGNRNYNVIGIPYSDGTVCTDNGYQVIEFRVRFADFLRSLVTHETGHSFSCPHDYEIGTTCDNLPPYIMAPVMNYSNTWSHGLYSSDCDKNSTAIINAYYPDVACLTQWYGYPLPSGDRWVDFSNTNCNQDGTPLKPMNTVIMGVEQAGLNQTIFIKPGVSGETITISKACKLQRDGIPGVVTIGKH